MLAAFGGTRRGGSWPDRIGFDHTLGYPGEGPHGGPGAPEAPRLALVTVNASASTTLVEAVLPAAPVGAIILAQETRVVPTPRQGELPADRFAVRARRAGYATFGTPAYSAGRGGHGGGVAILWPPSADVKPGAEIVPGRAVSAAWTTRVLGEVTLVALYGVSGGGLAGNRDLWGKVARHLAATGKPFIIGGDHNLVPAEVSTLLAELAMPAMVVAPRVPTFFGAAESLLDYYVVHKRLAAAAAPLASVLYDIPVAPHRAVGLDLRAANPAVHVPVLLRPRPPPATPVHGPQWESAGHAGQLAELATSAAALKRKVWELRPGHTAAPTPDAREQTGRLWDQSTCLAAAEIEAATGARCQPARAWAYRRMALLDATCMARGKGSRPMPSRALVFMRSRLLDARAALLRVRARCGGLPCHGAALREGRQELRVLLTAALRRNRCSQLTAQLKAAVATHAGDLQPFMREWTRCLRGLPGLLVTTLAETAVAIAQLDTLSLRLAELANSVRPCEWKLSRADWTEFARTSLAGNARAAHRMSRLAEAMAPAAGTLADQVQSATVVYGRLWGSDKQAASFVGAVVPVGPMPTPQALREAARTFPAHTSAPDGWSLRHFALLGDPALSALCELLHLAEVAGGYADQLEELAVRLIPKRAGGFRPICLFRSVARLHFRVLAGSSREWEGERAALPAFNNTPGRRIQDSTWRNWIRHALTTSGHSAEVLLDLAKAFEMVQRPLLWEAAERAGYPLATLRLALAAYSWRRRLVGDYGVASEAPIAASMGVAAGSAFATYELKLMLLGTIAAFTAAHPALPLSVHVDDFTVSARRASQQEVVRDIAGGVVHLVAMLSDIGLAVSPAKTEIIGTTDELVSAIRRALAIQASGAGLGQLPPPAGAAASTKGPAAKPRSVRKLGVTRTAEPSAAAGARRRSRATAPFGVKTVVKQTRLAAFANRLAKCKALFGKVRFRRIMHTGLLPAALYGAELTAFSLGELNRLRTGALVSEGLAAPGIAKNAAWAILTARSDPEFLAYSAPLIRYAHEVWTVSGRREATGSSGQPPADALTPRELAAVVNRLQNHEEAPTQGPIAVLGGALRHFGLSLRSPTSVWRGEQEWANLGYCSPAMLARSLSDIRREAAQTWADARHGGPVDLGAFRAVASRASPAEARVLAHLLGGTTRTFARAHGQGARCDAACPACGYPDSVRHRVEECPAGGPPLSLPPRCRLSGLGAPLWPALALSPPADAPMDLVGFVRVTGDGDRRFIDRGSTDPWPSSHEVFTDGSGLFAGSPAAVAAGSAVQAVARGDWPEGCQDGDVAVFRAVARVLPSGMPATSYGGEVMGLLLASQYLAPGPEAVTIVSDWLNAVRRGNAYARRTVAPTDQWGGLYRQFLRAMRAEGDRPWIVTKTRAHRAFADAVAEGDVDRWRGNDAADWAAGQAIARAFRADKNARAAMHAGFRGNRRLLRQAVARLIAVRAAIGVPPPVPRDARVARVRAALALGPGDRHSFRWCEVRGRYRRDKCSRVVRGLPPPGNKCLSLHPALSRALGAARRGGHCIQLCAVQGPAAGLLAICTRCGAYGAERASLLARQCGGTLGARRRFVEAVAAGRHPVCKASRVERVWALGSAGAAPDATGGAPAAPGGVAPAEVPPSPGEPGDQGAGSAHPSRGPELAPPVLAPPELEDDEWPLEDLAGWFGEAPNDLG